MPDNSDRERAGLPALPSAHLQKGFSLNVAGIPIPLRRTIGAIDRLLAIPIEALGDKLEQKIRGNLDSHVDSVQKKRRKRRKPDTIDDPSVMTAKAIAEWAVAASEIDDEDKDLSAIWRAILDQIMQDQNEGEELLRIAKSLSHGDLRYFVRRFAIRPGPKMGVFLVRAPFDMELKRVREAGLIRRLFYDAQLVVLGSACAGMLWLYISGLLGDAMISIDGLRLVFGVTVAIVLAMIFASQYYKLTRLGGRLRDLYREYVEDP